jgi:N-acetylglucosamine kinase
MIVNALVPHDYAIGVDGGATKTISLLGTEEGEVIGRGRAGPSNYHNVGPLAAARAIKQSVAEARRQARITGRRAEVAVVALAATNSPSDRAVVQRFVKGANIARRSFVVHDSVAALYAATQGRSGIIVIAGTGCVAAGINKNGQYARAGGWGCLVDDEGSAYDIARKALNKAYRMIDGRTPRTRLVSILKRRFRVKSLEDAQKMIYANGLSVEELAQFAPLVSRAASHDKVCREILNDAGVRLGELVCAVARQLKMTKDPITVATVGGNFKSGRYLLRPFTARIVEECRLATIRNLEIDPARGALSLAVSELQRRNGRGESHGQISRWLK